MHSWAEVARGCRDRRVVTLFALGISAGLPLLLIFSTLSVWLSEAGMARADITLLSWAALGYGFKYVWAPIIDRMPVFVLTALMGQRRSWLLIAQISIMIALLGMAWTDPAHSATAMAGFAVMLGFSSATQDIVIDAYRIEVADVDLQGILAAAYIAGYRVGMIVAGAGSLEIAGLLDSSGGGYDYDAWAWTYTIMAGVMLFGVATTLLVKEPEIIRDDDAHLETTADHARFFLVFLICAAVFVGIFILSSDIAASAKVYLSDGLGKSFAGFLVEAQRLIFAMGAAFLLGRTLLDLNVASRALVSNAYIGPFRDFFARFGKHALLVIALIALYRSADVVMGAIANVFYIELGFEKQIIGRITKGFGLVMTIVGGFLGGLMTLRYGVMKILFLGAVLAAATNLLFAVLATLGPDVAMLSVVIAADNLSAGLASAAFVAYLSALTSVQFTATQYALFSSLMLLLPKLIAGYSGGMVDAVGYETFFIATAVLGIPVMILILFAARLTKVE